MFGTGSFPAAIDAVTEGDVSGVHAKVWKSGVSIASLGDLSKVPKWSAISK